MVGEQDQSSQEFTNFYSYASRVGHLEYDNLADLDEIDQTTYIRLLQAQITWLPKLTSITLSHQHSAPLAFPIDKCLILLPSLLRSLFLESVSYHLSSTLSWELGQLLSMLRCPHSSNIRAIQLSGGLAVGFFGSFASLRSLKSVHLTLTTDSWNSELFNILLALELVEVHLDMSHADMLFLEQTPHGNASTLKKLSLCGGILSLRRVLRVLAPQGNLESVSLRRIGGRRARSEANIDYVFEDVARFPSVTTLLIDWNYANSFFTMADGSIGPVQLQHLTQLQSLTLKSLPPSIYFSDDAIRSVIDTWPFLKVLCIEYTSAPAVARPTISSIYHIVTTSPQLVTLSMTVDLGGFGHDMPVSSHNLQNLDLQDTVIDRPMIVARHLDRLFPNLVTFTMRDSHLGEQIRGIIFDVCKPVRKDQQKRDFDSFQVRGYQQL
jgi:hypothetical protein